MPNAVLKDGKAIMWLMDAHPKNVVSGYVEAEGIVMDEIYADTDLDQ